MGVAIEDHRVGGWAGGWAGWEGMRVGVRVGGRAGWMGGAGRDGLGVAIEDRWVGMNGGVGSMEIGCFRLRSMTAVRDGRVG